MDTDFSLLVQDEKGRWSTGEVFNSPTDGITCQWVVDNVSLTGKILMWVRPDDRFPSGYLAEISRRMGEGADLIYTDLMVRFFAAYRALYFKDVSEQELLAGRLAWSPYAIRANMWNEHQPPAYAKWLEWFKLGKRLVHIPDLYLHRHIKAEQWAETANMVAKEAEQQVAALRRFSVPI